MVSTHWTFGKDHQSKQVHGKHGGYFQVSDFDVEGRESRLQTSSRNWACSPAFKKTHQNWRSPDAFGFWTQSTIPPNGLEDHTLWSYSAFDCLLRLQLRDPPIPALVELVEGKNAGTPTLGEQESWFPFRWWFSRFLTVQFELLMVKLPLFAG